jgi:hypothetical protein
MINVLIHCVMILWFLVPLCSVPLLFGCASTLDLQSSPSNIYTILIDNDCVQMVYFCEECLAVIQLHPLAKVMVSNSLFDVLVKETEELPV